MPLPEDPSITTAERGDGQEACSLPQILQDREKDEESFW